MDFRMMDKAMVIMISEVEGALLAGEIAKRSTAIPTSPTPNAEKKGIAKSGTLNEYSVNPINPPRITKSP